MQKNLKIIYAMIRSPHLCNLVHRTERQNYEKEQLDKIYKQSIFTLR